MSHDFSNDHSTRRLDTLGLGEEGLVQDVRTLNSQLRNKLLTMGVVDDTPVRVTNVAPLGDPITVSVRGFRLSLRRSEANSIVLRRKVAA